MKKSNINTFVTKWLSNPINITLILVLTYSMALYIMYMNLDMREFMFVSLLLIIGAFFVRILGVARGMVVATLERERINRFMNELKKYEKKRKKKK